MSRTQYLTLTVSSLLATALAMSPAARGSAALESECRSEAQLYEIPEEQLADYIAGCLASRGGTLEMEPMEEEVPEQSPEGTDAYGGETQDDASMDSVEQ